MFMWSSSWGLHASSWKFHELNPAESSCAPQPPPPIALISTIWGFLFPPSPPGDPGPTEPGMAFHLIYCRPWFGLVSLWEAHVLQCMCIPDCTIIQLRNMQSGPKGLKCFSPSKSVLIAKIQAWIFNISRTTNYDQHAKQQSGTFSIVQRPKTYFMDIDILCTLTINIDSKSQTIGSWTPVPLILKHGRILSFLS